MRILLLILLLAGAAFASTYSDCDKSCCTSNGGSWDSDYEYCDIDYGSSGYNSYNSCYNSCWESEDYSYSSDYSCCGPAFLLLGIVGFALRSS
jgi:hypothetical protein